jgi:hypothetical protein
VNAFRGGEVVQGRLTLGENEVLSGHRRDRREGRTARFAAAGAMTKHALPELATDLVPYRSAQAASF